MPCFPPSSGEGSHARDRSQIGFCCRRPARPAIA
nr:MAG TPA: Clip-domain serine protease-like protein [Caudoviricetes sp.]